MRGQECTVDQAFWALVADDSVLVTLEATPEERQQIADYASSPRQYWDRGERARRELRAWADSSHDELTKSREALAALRAVEERLAQMDRALADLRGESCQKCSACSGDLVVLIGGYEAILCRACRNAWAVEADESGHWMEYRKVVATAKATRDFIKSGRGLSVDAIEGAIDRSVENLVVAERNLFQLAMKWLAGDVP